MGQWDISFDADSLAAPRIPPGHPAIRGSLTFALATHGPAALGGLRGITHVGVYDVDFAPLGFTPEVDGGVPSLVARVVKATELPVDSASRDSVYVTLRLAGDTATGSWSASAFSAGGGAGHFVMRRRQGHP